MAENRQASTERTHYLGTRLGPAIAGSANSVRTEFAVGEFGMSPASSQVVALGLIVIVIVVGALTISAREAKGTITHQAKSVT